MSTTRIGFGSSGKPLVVVEDEVELGVIELVGFRVGVVVDSGADVSASVVVVLAAGASVEIDAGAVTRPCADPHPAIASIASPSTNLTMAGH